MNLEIILFFLFGVCGIISAVLVVTRRNPIISAIWLIVNFFCLSGIYLILNAQFIAVIQILVYAGAIMVLFVFVIMLLNLAEGRSLIEGFSWKKVFAITFTVGLLIEILYIILYNTLAVKRDFLISEQIGTVENIGKTLFTQFLFPFEIISLLLCAAIVGAIVIAKKKIF